MKSGLPRVLYLIAAVSWGLLLYPNPVTIFLAACFSCLTLPIYRKLRYKSVRWRRKHPQTQKNFARRCARLFMRAMPWGAYTSFIFFCIFAPVAILALLVSPQALAGYTRLKELQANNLLLPPSWVEYFNEARAWLAEYPRLEKIINDGLSNIDTLFSDAVGILVSRSFGFLGGTMTVLWLTFLFVTLTVLFTVHARLIRKISTRILQIPPAMLGSFIVAVHKALRAITLGIAFVALVQGALCGIAFAVVGISQPAFWGLLATIVAPIPMVGTALVWAPLAVSLWFTGNSMGAVGLALWGALFVSGVDNVLRPFFLRQGIEASFFVLILAILCGLSVFGAVGLIAGPVILAIGMRAYDEAHVYYGGKS